MCSGWIIDEISGVKKLKMNSTLKFRVGINRRNYHYRITVFLFLADSMRSRTVIPVLHPHKNIAGMVCRAREDGRYDCRLHGLVLFVYIAMNNFNFNIRGSWIRLIMSLLLLRLNN